MMTSTKLVYVGRMLEIEALLGVDGRMWNIINPSSPFHKSTRTLEGLKEMGLI